MWKLSLQSSAVSDIKLQNARIIISSANSVVIVIVTITWMCRGSWWRGRTCRGAAPRGRWGGWSPPAAGRTRWARAGWRWTGSPGHRVLVSTLTLSLSVSDICRHVLTTEWQHYQGKAGIQNCVNTFFWNFHLFATIARKIEYENGEERYSHARNNQIHCVE